MEERDKGRLLANLKSLPYELDHLLVQTSDEDLRWRPIPNKPSIGETLLLLRDFEREALQVRLRRTATEDSPSLESWSVPAAVAERGYSEQDARAALGEFANLRRETVAFLESVPVDDWGRVGVHPEYGPSTIEDQVVRQIKNFDLTNLVQIKDILRIKLPW